VARSGANRNRIITTIALAALMGLLLTLALSLIPRHETFGICENLQNGNYMRTNAGLPFIYHYENYDKSCNLINPGGPNLGLNPSQAEIAKLFPPQGYNFSSFAKDIVVWSFISFAGFYVLNVSRKPGKKK
jgi:hypothetical protein